MLQDGSRDRGFGRDGLVITAFGRLYRPYPHAGSSRAAFPSSLVLQRDGKVVIVGSSVNSPESFTRPECCPPSAIAMARYFTAPLGRVTWAPRRPQRESVVRRGLAFGLRCVERCDVRAELRLDRRTARRLQIPALVARRSGRMSAGGTRTLVLRLGSRARRALSRPGTAGAELRVTFSGAPEHPDVSRIRISLR